MPEIIEAATAAILADLQAVWDRIAAGEVIGVVIDPETGESIALDEPGA